MNRLALLQSDSLPAEQSNRSGTKPNLLRILRLQRIAQISGLCQQMADLVQRGIVPPSALPPFEEIAAPARLRAPRLPEHLRGQRRRLTRVQGRLTFLAQRRAHYSFCEPPPCAKDDSFSM